MKDKSEAKALNAFFTLAVFWHICLFSVFFVVSPSLGKQSKVEGIEFIGSFLQVYDFDSKPAGISNAGGYKYLKFAKQNVKVFDLTNKSKLSSLLDKPQDNILRDSVDSQYLLLLSQEPLGQDFISDSLASAGIELLGAKDLPDLNIYFQEGIPRPIKFDLLIRDNGRVGFVDKVITSGNFDADMVVQRALIRSVFDTGHFGSSHRRVIELNLKK